MKHLTFKTVFLLALGSGNLGVRYMLGKTKTLDTNPTGGRCPCTHHPAFLQRISWPRRVQQCGPSGYTHVWIGPSSLTGPSDQSEHCATIQTGPQNSGRIKSWSLLSPAGRAGDYKTHSVRAWVCSCVIECVSRFYKGLYITLVVSPWPFQCFL